MARAISLFVISLLSYESMLLSVVDMRGGCDYIKNYHIWNMVFCCATSIILFEVVYRLIPVVRKFPWFMQWIAYAHLILAIVFIALPLADRMALRHEKAMGKPFDAEKGYGWYYWDDSGMGGQPITSIYLIYFFLSPLRMICFLAGSGAVFALTRERIRETERFQSIE